MAKQPGKQSIVAPKKQPPKVAEFSAFTYLWRNFAILIGFAIILFGIDKFNVDSNRLQELYTEFMQLKQSNSNPERMQEVYKEAMEIQGDTSYFHQLTRGYHWAVHTVAIGGSKAVEDIKNQSSKPLTVRDKFAMRVSCWKLIEAINTQTPPDAVIYLPPGDSSISNNGDWNYVYDPGWMIYFIYPRLCIAQGAEDHYPGNLAKRVTHVVIIEGKGYDKLKYDVPLEQRVQTAILPIDHPPVQNQQ